MAPYASSGPQPVEAHRSSGSCSPSLVYRPSAGRPSFTQMLVRPLVPRLMPWALVWRACSKASRSISRSISRTLTCVVSSRSEFCAPSMGFRGEASAPIDSSQRIWGSRMALAPSGTPWPTTRSPLSFLVTAPFAQTGISVAIKAASK